MKGDGLGEKQTPSEEGGEKRSQDDNRYVGNHQGLHKHLSDSLRDTHTHTHTHPPAKNCSTGQLQWVPFTSGSV